MNDCYLNFLVSFRALFSLDVGANLVNSKQTIGIILPDLSLLGYAVPVESFGIGLFVILFTYLIIEYNVQLLMYICHSPCIHELLYANWLPFPFSLHLQSFSEQPDLQELHVHILQ